VLTPLLCVPDGVAPRAKMNQQRTRRFMSRLTHASSKKNAKPTVYINRPYHDSTSRDVAAMLPEDIIIKDQSTLPTFDFDSNCVTPGTDFMAQAAHWLHLFAQSKLQSGIWGPEVVIVVSDSSVPGEGEHKIIDWIRRQKSLVERSHLIYGADADLIFLGLALHANSVRILREGSLPKAKSATFTRSGRSRGKVSRDTIFVSELHPHTTELELGQLFEPCGPIASVRIISEGHTKSTNFGFVRFGRVTASSGVSERELNDDEAVEVDRSVSRALLMNGHKLRGKAISVDFARGSTQNPLSEAEQLKILEQQDLLTVEFMSLMGIEDATVALACLNLAQWNMVEAQVIYLEYSSSGLPLELYLESKNFLKVTKSPSTPSKTNNRNVSSSPFSPSSSHEAPAAFSPMSPTEHSINLDDNDKDADKEEEADDEEVVSIDSPYVLVDLSELRQCFSNKFSRVSISSATRTPIDLEAIQKVAYKPNADRFIPSPFATESTPEINTPLVTVTIEPPKSTEEVLFKAFEVERVLDDFVLLGMLFGNDFLPSLPGQDIKTGSFNRLLVDYECVLVEEGYLCEKSDFWFLRLAKVLDHVSAREKEIVRRKIISNQRQAMQTKRKAERAEKGTRIETPLETPSIETPSVILAPESDFPSPSSSVPVTPTPNSILGMESPIAGSPQKHPFQPRRRRASKERADGESPSNNGPFAVGEDGAPVSMMAPKPRVWYGNRDVIPEPTDADHLSRRVVYYQDNFPEIDFSALSSDEEKLQHAKRTICVEYLRGISWVMRYYFRGCESWEWYYPHHYAPFASDVAAQLRDMIQEGSMKSADLFAFSMSEPFSPLEQLVAVLPPDSVLILPRPLRHLVTDLESPLFPFFPSSLHIQKSDGISGAVAKWHGILRLPFIPKDILKETMKQATKKLDLADLARNQFTKNVAYFGSSHPLFDVCTSLPIGSFNSQMEAENGGGGREEQRESISPRPPSSAPNASPQSNAVSPSIFDPPKSANELSTSQEIIDSLFQMPMKNVRQSPLMFSSGPYTTLMFDVTPTSQ